MAWLFALSDAYLIGMSLWLLAGCIAFWGLLKWRRRVRRLGRKPALANLLLSVWLLLSLLTGVELYFALFFDGTDSFNMSNVSKVWFRRHVEPEQHALRLGSEGIKYRDDQVFPRPVPQDRRHICFIGDSFTFGHGVADVSDRFTNRIRAKLETDFPGEYLVTNLADSGTDLDWDEALVRKMADEQIRIDTLVYVFCPNDIEVYHPDFMKLMHELADVKPQFPLFRDTYFFNLLYYRIRLASVPGARDYYGFLADYYRGAPWQKMRAQLEVFAGFCKSRKIKLEVVIFPFLQNLDQASPFDQARKVVRTFCEEQNIPVLDLHSILSEHADENLTVSLFDAHPNARAHELAAQAILPFLLEEEGRQDP